MWKYLDLSDKIALPIIIGVSILILRSLPNINIIWVDMICDLILFILTPLGLSCIYLIIKNYANEYWIK